MPLTKFIKIQKVLTDTSTEASLCGRGAGEREKCERAVGDGKGKRGNVVPLSPARLLLFSQGYQAGACAEERGATTTFPLEGNDGADPGSNLGVDDICGCWVCWWFSPLFRQQDSKTARNVIVGWKTKTCTILCPPHSVFLRIYVLKMSRGKRRKWHFQDRKLKNFLREYIHRHPLVWSAFGDLTFLSARTPSKSKATPLIHIPIGTHLCYFLEVRSKLNTMPAPRSVKIDNPRIFTANNSLMEWIVIELRD